MRKFYLFIVFLFGAGGPLLVYLAGYSHHLINLYEYTFLGGSYINRTFSFKEKYVKQGDELYKSLVNSLDTEDHRWGTANFSRPINQQINVPAKPEFLDAYSYFIKDFKDRFYGERGTPSDSLAAKVNDFVHEQWKRNKSKSSYDFSSFHALAEKDRHPEVLIYSLRNYSSACGTISETSVAFLRDLGFTTRLMRISHTPGEEIANHVFLEYYSPNWSKWVMFDAMVNFIPTRDGRPMSAFEFFSTPSAEDSFRQSGRRYPNMKDGGEIWFAQKGPIQTEYRMEMRNY